MKLYSILFLSAGFLCSLSTSAHAIETAAKQALLIDATTQTVLLDKEGDMPMHPSSMSKLMTAYLLLEQLKQGKIKLEDILTVSEKAWKMQGSKTFVHVGDAIPVEVLLRGIIIQSGNDACIVVAEGLAGSEEAFAQRMNAKAAEFGMTKSNFVNATGWPDEKHLMSPRDLAILAQRIITDFPEYYHYYSEREYSYNNITQQNRNRLLGRDIGVDGLKTGHTEIAGYGITLSAKQGERRLILVINGLESDNARVEEGDKLLRWGFREFTNKTLVKAGQEIAAANVWFGTQKTVPLTAEKDVVVTLPTANNADVKFTLKYTGPLQAPVDKGSHVADLVIRMGETSQTVPLLAAADVPKLSGISRMIEVLKYYLRGRDGAHAG